MKNGMNGTEPGLLKQKCVRRNNPIIRQSGPYRPELALNCWLMRPSRLLSARIREARVREVACRNGVASEGASLANRSNESAESRSNVLSTLATTSAERGP